MNKLASGLVGSGGVLFALGNVLHPLEHSDAAHAAATWESAHLIFALGGLLIAAGLPLLLATGEIVRRSRLATIGGVLLAIGFAALTPGAWFEAFVAPLPDGVAQQVEAGAGGTVNAMAGMVFLVGLVLFGIGLAWRGARTSVRLSGWALLVAAVIMLVGPGLPVVEGLAIIPATVVAGAALLVTAVAGPRTAQAPAAQTVARPA